MIKKIFQVREVSCCPSSALLALRLAAGLAMALHGVGKIQNPFGWMGAESGVPAILQALAAVSEFGGGIAWMLGLVFPLASFGIFCTMAVAAYTHLVMRGDPFVGKGATGELAVIYFFIAMLFMSIGPGRLSLDRFIFKMREPNKA